MNTQANMYFLSGALVLTILSSCATAYGLEARAATARPASEVRAPEPLSLEALRQRLRATQSISLANKVGLKFEIDGLVEKFRSAHVGGREVYSLRLPYDSLIARIRSLLVRDPQLAADIAMSREAIWDVMADPSKFAYAGSPRDSHGLAL